MASANNYAISLKVLKGDLKKKYFKTQFYCQLKICFFEV